MAGTATIRRIAGDIQEIAILVTAGTRFRGLGGADRKVALAASPISQVALRADIPGEFPGSGITAQITFLFLFLGRHHPRLPFSCHCADRQQTVRVMLEVLAFGLKSNHCQRRNKV